MAVLSRTEAVEAVPERRRNRPDAVLFVTVAALSGLGLLMIYTASRALLVARGLPPTQSMQEQMIFVAAGLLVFIVATFVDYRDYRHYMPFIYVGMLVSLVAVLFFPERNGARSWIELGPFAVQPSELAKVGTILALASVWAPARIEGMGWKRIFQGMAVMAIPAALIFLQPDVGTMLVFVFVAAVMLFVGGGTFRHVVVLTGLGAGTVWGILRLGLLQDYQAERIRSLLDPTVDPLGTGWQQAQSEYAIGSGQLFGKGLLQGSSTNLSFVPEQQTDFIFAAVGEQLGFVGGILVLAAYLVIIWRLLVIARNSRDRFGALLAVGFAALLMFHVFVNIGMAVGIIPITGLPLPLLSRGGSFYLTVALSMGIANSIWLRRSPVPGETYIL